MQDNNEKIPLENLANPQKEQLLNWATKVRGIQKDVSLNRKEKLRALKKLENKKAFKSLALLAKSSGSAKWKKSNWATRLGLISGGGTLLLLGGTGAGVAALGTAIGIPFFLLTASGGALIGVILDSIVKKNKE